MYSYIPTDASPIPDAQFRLAELLSLCAPEPPPLPRCVNDACNQVLNDDDVRYFYKDGGALVGCAWCVIEHDRADEPTYLCDCARFNPLTTETVYTIGSGSDVLLGCSDCIVREVGL